MNIKRFITSVLAALLIVPTLIGAVSAAEMSQNTSDILEPYLYTIADATQVQRIVAKLFPYEDSLLDIYDVNFDGYIKIDDATLIQKHCAGYFDINSEEYRNQYLPVLPSENTVPLTSPTDTYVEQSTVAVETTITPTENTTEAVKPTEAVTKPSTIVEETTVNITEPITEAVEPTKNGPSYIKLKQESLKLGKNESYTLVIESDSKDFTATYTSSNTNIAEVNNSGRVIAKNIGTALIICKTDNGLSATCKVNICAAATSLSLNKDNLTLGVGEKFDLDSYVNSGAAAYFRYYSSDNDSVATVVRSGGYVTAKSPGTANITCLLENGVKAVCKVTVKELSTSITLNATNITVGVGEIFDFNSYIPSGTAAYYRAYYSENKSVAKIEKSGGLMTAINTGATRIYCEAINGVRAYADITVKAAPTSVSINQTSSTLKVGNTITLSESTNSGSYAKNVSWSTSNSSVAYIVNTNENKVTIKAMSLGTITITVKTYNGKTAQCKITVSGSATKAIDISTWQGGYVDFNKVHSDGIDYVIIRAGFSETEDNQFENNYKKAKAAGLKVGIYWYMYAKTTNEAKREAQACLKYLKGKVIDLPVYYDIEEPSVIWSLSQSSLTNLATTFGSAIQSAGYKPGVYSSGSIYSRNYKLNYDLLVNLGYSIWDAEWASSYTIPCDVWQYSSSGKVNGISGNVDMNYIYNLNIEK